MSTPTLIDAEPTTAKPTLALQIINGAECGRSFELPTGATTIGGGPRCSLRLAKRGLKPLHCVVTRDDRGMSVRRWSSETHLNGESFTESALQPGDLLTIADVDLVVCEDEFAASMFDAPRTEEPLATVAASNGVAERWLALANAAPVTARQQKVDHRAARQGAKQRVKRLVSELRAERTRLNEAGHSVAELEGLNAELASSLDEARAEAQSAADLTARREGEIHDIQQQLDAATAELESLRATTEQSDARRIELEEEIDTLRADVLQRTTLAEESERRVCELESAIADLERAVNEASSYTQPPVVLPAEEPVADEFTAEHDAPADAETPPADEWGAADATENSAAEDFWTAPTAEPTAEPAAEPEPEVDEASHAEWQSPSSEDSPSADLWSTPTPVEDEPEVKAETPAPAETPSWGKPFDVTPAEESASAPAESLWDIETAPAADPASEPEASVDDVTDPAEAEEASAPTAWDVEEPAVGQPAAEEPAADFERVERAPTVALPVDCEEEVEPQETFVEAEPAADLSESFESAAIDDESESFETSPAEVADAEPQTADDLIPTEQPSGAAPESFIDRFADLLPADEVAADAGEPIATPEPPAVAAPAASEAPEAGDDDGSIDDYMASLMSRIRGDSAAPATPAAMPVAATPEPAPKPEAAEETPPPAPITDLEELRSVPAPEQSHDLSAMRDLANHSARKAIGVAESQENQDQAVANLVISCMAMGCGAYLAVTAPSFLDLQALGGLAAFGWAGYWAANTLRHMNAASKAANRPTALTDGEAESSEPAEPAIEVEQSTAGY